MLLLRLTRWIIGRRPGCNGLNPAEYRNCGVFGIVIERLATSPTARPAGPDRDANAFAMRHRIETEPGTSPSALEAGGALLRPIRPLPRRIPDPAPWRGRYEKIASCMAQGQGPAALR